MDQWKKEKILHPPEVFDFPFPPYSVQHDFMTKMYECIEQKKLGIFESPTGTGKSLSIICSALKWLKDEELREREMLSQAISEVLEKKDQLANFGDDWISCQAEEIELMKQLNALKIEEEKIKNFDKKLSKLRVKKKERLVKRNLVALEKNVEPLNSSKDDIDEDIDVIINDEDADSQSNSDGEEEEDKYIGTQILVCSRTHSQLSQLVGEVLRSPYGETTRLVSLASRQNYCINPNVSKLPNVSLINERCIDLQSSKKGKSTAIDKDGKTTKKKKTDCKCPFMQSQLIEDLRDRILLDVQDVEQLVNEGKRSKACPYYASRAAVRDAQVIFVPYNTLLHKPARDASGLRLENNVVIIDEAHNLLDAIGNMYSAEVTGHQLVHALSQLKAYRDRYHSKFSATNLLHINQLIYVVGKLVTFLGGKAGCASSDSAQKTEEITLSTLQDFVIDSGIDNYNTWKLTEFCKRTKLSQKLHGFTLKFEGSVQISSKPKETGVKAFLKEIKETKEAKKGKVVVEEKPPEIKPVEKSMSNPLLPVLGFLEALSNRCDDGRIVSSKTLTVGKGFLKFLLLNPAAHFDEVVQKARAVIVAGGTMQPTSEFEDRLFIAAGASPERIMSFSCGHVVPQENIRAFIVQQGPSGRQLDFSYGSRDSTEMIDEAGRVLQNICNVVPGGVVCFFPSYGVEKSIYARLEQSGILNVIKKKKKIFREPQKSSEVDFVLNQYSKIIKLKPEGLTGALMFSVVGGKLSEGLNFSDDLGRCVIVVGLPYPNIKSLELKEKIGYLNKNVNSSAGNIYYENLCMKAVNQCIGRAVRHKNDYASIVLLDYRFSRQNIQNALPSWIQASLCVAPTFGSGFSQLAKQEEVMAKSL